MTLIINVVDCFGQARSFEYDPNDDYELLKFQILSLYGDLNEFILVDYAGRTVTGNIDLLDITFKIEDLSVKDGHQNGLYLWIINYALSDLHSICSSQVYPSLEVIQPCWRSQT